MKRTDHILALTTTLLHADDEDHAVILEAAEKLYNLREPRKSGTVSLGADENGAEQSLGEWLKQKRAQGVQRVTVSFEAFDAGNNMPAHMAAAFAGIADMLLQIVTTKGRHTYLIDTYFSPPYEITPAQFITLINAQSEPDIQWKRVAYLVLESNGLNNRSIFDPSEIEEYLLTQEGGHAFGLMVSDLIKEVQIECTIREKSFIIPEDFRAMFVRFDSPLFDFEEREFVVLYPIRDVTATEVLALVHAHPYGIKIWEGLNQLLEEYDEPGRRPMDAGLWEEALTQMPREDVQRLANTICRSICTLCETNHAKPVIPADLADAFGPDEEDQKRAAARSKDKDRWMLQQNQDRWEHYNFRAVPFDQPLESITLVDAKIGFIKALQATASFAKTIQSPFEEAFSLALFALQKSSEGGTLTIEESKLLEEQLKDEEFSAEAIENFQQANWVIEFGNTLGWNQERTCGLMAVRFADVFGGMGSWNDQYVEQDYETYQRVSGQLFDALKRYMAALLSG